MRSGARPPTTPSISSMTCGRNGLAEQEALQLVAADGLQEALLLRRLHALRRDGEAERAPRCTTECTRIALSPVVSMDSRNERSILILSKRSAADKSATNSRCRNRPSAKRRPCERSSIMAFSAASASSTITPSVSSSSTRAGSMPSSCTMRETWRRSPSGGTGWATRSPRP